MGFWQTGYQEFHEPVGLDWDFKPGPIAHDCSICDQTFRSLDDLRRHRFQDHPIRRPALFVGGCELGVMQHRLMMRPCSDDVRTDYATTAIVNGRQIQLDQLGQRLSSAPNGVLEVWLRNGDVEARFMLSIEVATEADLVGIESAFEAMARQRRLDLRAIEAFIEMCRPYVTATSYCDGLCDYLYGVLAKERAAESSLPQDAYREKFNRAAYVLRGVPRGLAAAACGLVAFNFNQFAEAEELARTQRVGMAASRFRDWIQSGSKTREVPLHQAPGSIDGYLTDQDTERLVIWALTSSADLAAQSSAMEAMVREDISELDRSKLRIALAELYAGLGNTRECQRHALELRNSPGFEQWAERLIVHPKREK